jgi:hypothetical protein
MDGALEVWVGLDVWATRRLWMRRGLAEMALLSGRQGFGWLRKAVRASHKCPHLKIEIWGTQIQMWATRQPNRDESDLGHPPPRGIGWILCMGHPPTRPVFYYL